MKLSYKQRLFLYFFFIFALFTMGIIVVEQSHVRDYKTEALEEKLDAYADMVNASLIRPGSGLQELDSLMTLLPQNIRLTLIDKQGEVLYDNALKEAAQMENHAQRPEVIASKGQGRRSDIRVSASNQQAYLYYAKRFNNYFIRVALPYDVEVQHFLKSDNAFLYYIIGLFALMLVLINFVANRFGKSIAQLRDFAQKGGVEHVEFPADELGEIGAKIAEDYRQLKETKRTLSLEREKLLQHVHSSEEGLCFFSADRTVEFYNGLFIQYLNIIVDDSNSDPAMAFTDPSFEQVAAFLAEVDEQETYFETQITKQGKVFTVRVNVFESRGFEIIINDITRQEKTRRLKQEMTGNIAHELRTPVTSIRGYLETVLEQPIDKNKEHNFLTKAYNQTLSLSELIQDMGLITKIEGAPQAFQLEAVSLLNILESVQTDLAELLQEKGITIGWDVTDEVVVNGNRNLLYSIFRNLTDNAVRYAGSDVKIFVSCYRKASGFYYFSYSDTGVGIADERHFNRLFERFYRINEGRTRDSGGSGLGLSIVKNAIQFHRGKIVAKNRAGGGLEFLFKLPE